MKRCIIKKVADRERKERDNAFPRPRREILHSAGTGSGTKNENHPRAGVEPQDARVAPDKELTSGPPVYGGQAGWNHENQARPGIRGGLFLNQSPRQPRGNQWRKYGAESKRELRGIGDL